MPSIEAPARLAGTLCAMHAGLGAIGVDRTSLWGVVTKLAWDSIPDVRRRLLLQLRQAPEPLSTADLVTLTGVPKTTAERTLEDLALLGLLSRHKTGTYENSPWSWRLSEHARTAWPRSTPEMSAPNNSNGHLSAPEKSEAKCS